MPLDRLSKRMSPLALVPLDVFFLILKQLSIQDILNLRECCRALRDKLQDRSLWADVNRALFALFPQACCQPKALVHSTVQELRERVVRAHRVHLDWTIRPRSFQTVHVDPRMTSATLLPGGTHFLWVLAGGMLNLHRAGQHAVSFSARQRCPQGAVSSLVVSPPSGSSRIGNLVAWRLPSPGRVHAHEIFIYRCDLIEETLTLLVKVPTEILVQRFAVGHDMLVVAGYALRSQHRYLIHVYAFDEAQGTSKLVNMISLDESVDRFGEVLGISLVSSRRLLVLFRRGVCVYKISPSSHDDAAQVLPTWSEDLSDHYSASSECSIGHCINLRRRDGTNASVCSLVTGDRFFIFKMTDAQSRYSIEPVEVTEGASIKEGSFDDDKVTEFRDRSASHVRCNFRHAVWRSPMRGKLLTVSLSPLSAFSSHADVGPNNFYGFDDAESKISLGELNLPPGVPIDDISDLSIDELSGKVGILYKGDHVSQFIVMNMVGSTH